MAERTRVYRTHAIVLRRRDYGDADRILTVLTPDKGRVEVIAKGVRKTNSRKAGHLEPYAHSSLLLAQARTWDIVTEAVTIEPLRHLREDLDAISRAGYIAELADAFGEGEEDHKLLWELTLETLRALDQMAAERAAGASVGDRNVLVASFMLHLLSITGFQPQLYNCLSCDESIEPVTNFLSIAEGGIYCPRCAQERDDLEAIDPDALKILRYLQRQRWENLRTLSVRPPVMRRAESVLHRYTIHVLEKQLRSVDFMRRMQNSALMQGDA